MNSDDDNPIGTGRSNEGGVRRLARSVGTGFGCVLLLVGAVILVMVGLAYVFNEPALTLAAVALVIAVVAYKSSRGRSSAGGG